MNAGRTFHPLPRRSEFRISKVQPDSLQGFGFRSNSYIRIDKRSTTNAIGGEHVGLIEHGILVEPVSFELGSQCCKKILHPLAMVGPRPVLHWHVVLLRPVTKRIADVNWNRIRRAPESTALDH